MKKDKWLGRIAVCIGLAFLTFLLLFAGVNAAEKGIVRAQEGSADVVISDWEFVWSDGAQALEGDIGQWQLANSRNPVVKTIPTLFSQQYIRLHASLPASDSARSLELITGGNPLKVWLNGKEVYNNRYGEALYTGNRINTVSLPASVSAPEIDVFLRVPLSFSLSARLVDPSRTVTMESLSNQIGMIGSLVLAVIGAFMALIMLLVLSQDKEMGTGVWLSLLIIAAGAGSFLNQLALHSTAFTNPWIFKAQIILLFLIAAGVSYVSVRTVHGWHAPEIVAVALTAGCAPAFAFLGDAAGVWVVAAFPVLLLFAAILVMLRLADAFRAHTRFAPLVGYAFLTAVFCQIYDAIRFVIGSDAQGAALRYAGWILFGVVMFSVLIRQALYTNVRLTERQRQIENDTRWVRKTVACCANIFAQKGLNDFCVETAKSIKELILFDRATDPDAVLSGSPVRVSMALVKNGGFEEIYKENTIEPCRYDTILERARAHEDQSVFFGESNLDIVMRNEQKPLCVLHIEGIENGLSANLRNIILSTYTSVSAALSSLETKMDMVHMQESVFINLAEIVEQKSYGTGEHLKAVAAMVAVLCDGLNIPEHEKHVISMASMVHDIGKLAVPDAIIGKEGKLTDEEYTIMQDHVIYGYNMMSKSRGEFMEAAAVIAQQHHEKYDGTGYLELRGEEIHLYARIVAVADVFDALLSERPYKKAWTPERAVAYINQQAGRHFDPQLVKVFNCCRDRLIAIKKEHA